MKASGILLLLVDFIVENSRPFSIKNATAADLMRVNARFTESTVKSMNVQTEKT